MALSRVTTKGQVTIPASIRKALNLTEGDQPLFELGAGSGPLSSALGAPPSNAYRRLRNTRADKGLSGVA